jgi:hypothetical protein
LDKKTISKNRFINMLLTLAASLISVYAIELVLRISPLSDRLGWNRTLPFSRRVEKFNQAAKIKIVALGDSFVEWRSGEGVNMFDHLQDNLSSKGCAVINLGSGGADIRTYIAIYKKYVNFKPDLVIMCVYLGDDIKNYPSYSEIDKISIVETEPADSVRQRLYLFLKKHSILANLIFRFAKERVPLMRSGIFDNIIKQAERENRLSNDFIQARIKQISPQILELARSDAINPRILALGIAFPSWSNEFLGLNSRYSIIAANATIDLIKEFYRKQNLNNFLVFILPESLQVSKDYDDFFKKCGFNLDGFSLQERRKLTEYIETRLNGYGIKTIDCTPALEKESDVYIKFDNHLNKRGHKIVGQLMTDYIKNKVLYIQ